MRILLAALIAFAAVAIAHAATSIVVEHPWARATPGGAANGVAYATLINKGSESDRLVGAASPVASSVQIHEEKTENGISHMSSLGGIDLAPGATVTLKPSGIHLMMALKQPLKKGATFPLTLTFQKAGPITVTVKVGSVGQMNEMDGMSGM
jgi:copper(I)-binding protein